MEKLDVFKTQDLLKEAGIIEKNQNRINEETGRNFNIIDLLIARKEEVSICKIIAELINPYGSHNQGDIYLKHFFNIVLKLEKVQDENLSEAMVITEYLISNGKRIDIVIETNKRFIPIEVKLNAPDRDNQCSDYFEEVKNHPKGAKLYYLTLFGKEPSENSASKEISSEIECISFKEGILNWLDISAEESSKLKSNNINTAILNLKEIIKRKVGELEDEMEEKIKELLIKSNENLVNGINIKKVLDYVSEKNKIETLKKDLLNNIFKKTKGEGGFIEDDYPDTISFPYKFSQLEGIDTYVFVETRYGVCVGYYFIVNDTDKMNDIPNLEELAYYSFERDGYRSYYNYYALNIDGCSEEAIDFENLNSSYYELYFNKNNCREEFCSEIAEIIESHLNTDIFKKS